jgi:hypothetical protein
MDSALNSFGDRHNISDIRKQEEVLGESYMMIPESKARCETSIGDLAALIVSLSMIATVLVLLSYSTMWKSQLIFLSFLSLSGRTLY